MEPCSYCSLMYTLSFLGNSLPSNESELSRNKITKIAKIMGV